MSRSPRLRFTKEEIEAPELKKSRQKVKRAEAKVDKAAAKLPTRKRLVSETVTDAKTGKKATKLRFKETTKAPPPSKTTQAIRNTPSNLAGSVVHRQVRDVEDDNVGVESAHKLEETAESGVRAGCSINRSRKLQPYRRMDLAERQLDKANVDFIHRSSALNGEPQFTSNPISRWQQKQAIKKEYAAAKRSGKTTVTTAKTTAKTVSKSSHAAKEAAKDTEKTASFVVRHRKGIAVVGIVGLMVMFLGSIMGSCSMMGGSVSSSVASSTFPSEDRPMLDAEAAYAGLEADLQSTLDNYESTHSYNEYHYDLDEIEHDPYVLTAILSALHQDYTLSEVQGTVNNLFAQQYTLTETVTTETRYRLVHGTDAEGNPTTSRVPYTYYICHVKLDNANLSHLPINFMSEEQLGVYATYIATQGNRPDLFPTSSYPHASTLREYTDYDIPAETLADPRFAAMITEAEKYLGYPYIWGGSSPRTSFDCSGFVSWVINHCGVGWNYGRLGASGLCSQCTPVSAATAKPGDLVFFKDTFDTGVPGSVSHCGIYVGNGMMIHCGSPISYANLNTTYWQEHLYCYGRLPDP